eukprot:scpid41056/ scgid21748/ 
MPPNNNNSNENAGKVQNLPRKTNSGKAEQNEVPTGRRGRGQEHTRVENNLFQLRCREELAEERCQVTKINTLCQDKGTKKTHMVFCRVAASGRRNRYTARQTKQYSTAHPSTPRSLDRLGLMTSSRRESDSDGTGMTDRRWTEQQGVHMAHPCKCAEPVSAMDDGANTLGRTRACSILVHVHNTIAPRHGGGHGQRLRSDHVSITASS